MMPILPTIKKCWMRSIVQPKKNFMGLWKYKLRVTQHHFCSCVVLMTSAKTVGNFYKR